MGKKKGDHAGEPLPSALETPAGLVPLDEVVDEEPEASPPSTSDNGATE